MHLRTVSLGHEIGTWVHSTLWSYSILFIMLWLYNTFCWSWRISSVHRWYDCLLYWHCCKWSSSCDLVISSLQPSLGHDILTSWQSSFKCVCVNEWILIANIVYLFTNIFAWVVNTIKCAGIINMYGIHPCAGIFKHI